MDKRYQVFVSSTFEDLKDERAKVMETILNNDCFPAGMEMFPAMDEEQFEYIKRIIDDSDYYLLIIGGRYGSVDENGVSWTEKEYDYAVEKNIHVIAFVLDDEAYNQLPLTRIDEKDIEKNRKKLKAFIAKVKKRRLIKYWSDANTLALEVTNSLQRVQKIHPQIGWVRANKVASGDALKEIDRLNNEITTYQKQVTKLEADLKKKEGNCSILEKSQKDAQQEIKNLQKTIDQLQQQCDELKAQKEQCDEDLLSIEQSYQEKVNDVTGDLEKVLDKLKGNKIETITIPGTVVSFKMIRVEGGTFMMGANDGDKDAEGDEIPAHQVTLSDYYIGETQVTQALWQAVMGNNPSYFKGDPNHPVECVSWDDCQEFVKKLNSLTGKSFHLPTEAQWEFAARGGNKSKGYKYAGGDDLDKVAWYGRNSSDNTHPVAQKIANELGLYDMSGNVWEWCQDWYGQQYSNLPQINPKGHKNGFYRVYRGGGWNHIAEYCRVSMRYGGIPILTIKNIGLRLAL